MSYRALHGNLASGAAPTVANDGEASFAYGRPPFEVRAYYNPERRSEIEIVPGLIGVILRFQKRLD
jgi:hypothetical protein